MAAAKKRSALTGVLDEARFFHCGPANFQYRENVGLIQFQVTLTAFHATFPH